jgi:anti-sigma factor RsiW
MFYLSRYQDGELDKPPRERVKAHLAQCPDCRQELQLLEQVTADIKHLPGVEAPLNFTAQVMAAVKEKEKPRRLALSRLVYSFVFIIFCLLGFLLNPHLKSPRQKPVKQVTVSDYSSLLAESQHLNLIEVQAKTLDMLYNGKDE